MVIVIIPVYNEEENVLILLERIHNTMNSNKLDYRTIVVNDGSTDNTLNICQTLSKNIPLIIVNHQSNLGLADTIKDGYLRALKIGREDEVIVRMDGDNTFSPEQIPDMIKKIAA
ncbi:MAG: glycosyltransferase family 2 protein, partial [Elusimicrobiota bacterium]|nr:glycosyltransferase family 2 protein [Elusimicrobiota bacterium]